MVPVPSEPPPYCSAFCSIAVSPMSVIGFLCHDRCQQPVRYQVLNCCSLTVQFYVSSSPFTRYLCCTAAGTTAHYRGFVVVHGEGNQRTNVICSIHFRGSLFQPCIYKDNSCLKMPVKFCKGTSFCSRKYMLQWTLHFRNS